MCISSVILTSHTSVLIRSCFNTENVHKHNQKIFRVEKFRTFKCQKNAEVVYVFLMELKTTSQFLLVALSKHIRGTLKCSASRKNHNKNILLTNTDKATVEAIQ